MFCLNRTTLVAASQKLLKNSCREFHCLLVFKKYHFVPRYLGLIHKQPMFPIIKKPANWFAMQINWLISILWGKLVDNELIVTVKFPSTKNEAFFVLGFLIKYEKIHSFLRICSYLLKKSLTKTLWSVFFPKESWNTYF